MVFWSSILLVIDAHDIKEEQMGTDVTRMDESGNEGRHNCATCRKNTLKEEEEKHLHVNNVRFLLLKMP